MSINQNPLSGLQVVALHGLLTTNEGFGPPQPSASTAAFEAIPTVAGFKDMLAAAATAGLSESELWTLKTIGSTSIPSLFGSLPAGVSAPSASDPGLQPGFALDQIAAKTTALFPPGAGSSIFIQTFTQAMGYASESYDVLKSAATATFGQFSDPSKLITGGLTNLTGNATEGLATLGKGLKDAGGLFDVSKLDSAFSGASVLKTVLDTGVDQVGNIHAKVLNQVLTDYDNNPILDSLGKPITITKDLIDSLAKSPFTSPSAGEDGPNPSFIVGVAQNQLDKDLVDFVASKLTPTELSSILSLNKTDVGSQSIEFFTQLTVPEAILGVNVIDTLTQAGVSTIDQSGITTAIKNSVGGLENLASTAALGNVCENLGVLDSSFNLIKDLTVPLSYGQFAELVGVMGGGSGPFGNAQVSDFLGGDPTKGIAAITDTVTTLAGLPEATTINADMTLLKNALAGGGFPVVFSDSSVANNLSEAVTYGSTVINSTADLVKTYADTNNLSATLTQYATAISASNISELLLSTAKIDISSMVPDVGTMVGFVSSLHSVANDTVLGGYETIKRFADPATKTGQAILATLTEGKNLAALSKAGLKIDNFNSISNYLGDGIGLTLPQPGAPGVGPPPSSLAPVPNVGSTVPQILSVRAYRPGPTDRASFEIRYQGVTNWQSAGFMIVSDELGVWLVSDPLTNNYPMLKNSYGTVVFQQDDDSMVGYGLSIPNGTQIDVVIINASTGVWITPLNGFASTLRCPMTSNTVAWPPGETTFNEPIGGQN